MVRKLTGFPRTGDMTLVPISNESLANLPILMSIFGIKSNGHFLTGIVPRTTSDTIKSQGAVGTEASYDEILSTDAHPDATSILSTTAREKLTTMLRWCLDCACVRIRKEHAALKTRAGRYEDDIVSRGSLSDKSKQLLDTHQKTFDKLFEYAKELADALDVAPPDLPKDEEEEASIPEAELVLWDRRKVGDGSDNLSDEAWAYGDEETRSFYEDLINPSEMLPAALFFDGAQPWLAAKLGGSGSAQSKTADVQDGKLGKPKYAISKPLLKWARERRMVMAIAVAVMMTTIMSQSLTPLRS